MAVTAQCLGVLSVNAKIAHQDIARAAQHLRRTDGCLGGRELLGKVAAGRRRGGELRPQGCRLSCAAACIRKLAREPLHFLLKEGSVRGDYFIAHRLHRARDFCQVLGRRA